MNVSIVLSWNKVEMEENQGQKRTLRGCQSIPRQLTDLWRLVLPFHRYEQGYRQVARPARLHQVAADPHLVTYKVKSTGKRGTVGVRTSQRSTSLLRWNHSNRCGHFCQTWKQLSDVLVESCVSFANRMLDLSERQGITHAIFLEPPMKQEQLLMFLNCFTTRKLNDKRHLPIITYLTQLK